MKRFLVVAALFLVTSVSVTAAPTRLLDSVRAIAIPVLEETFDPDSHETILKASFRNVCSSASINSEKRYWLTAAHCVDDPNYEYYIAGEKITVEMMDVPNDLAIVSTLTATAPPLKLAKRGPHMHDPLNVAGYPFGWPQAIFVTGRVAHPSLQFEEEGEFARPFMILNVTGAPGNSGSVVVNNQNDVISVVQVSWGRSFEPMLGGATWNILNTYREYFERR